MDTKTPAPSFVLSVLCYNQLDKTKLCVESILKFTGGNFRLHIWDNASRRDTYQYLDSLKDRDCRIVITHSPRNVGFILAHNCVFERYRYSCEYFVCLNNDLVIKEPDWNLRMADTLEQHGWSAVGAKQKFMFNNKFAGITRLSSRLDYVDGSLLMVKCHDLNFLPTLFDEKYLKHIYYEDGDLSLRLKNAGLEIGEVDVAVEHEVASTTSREKIWIDLEAAQLNNQAVMCDRWSIPRFEGRPLKILVNRPYALGDVLCIEPILRELLYKYPASEITVRTLVPEVLKYNGLPLKFNYNSEGAFLWDKVIDLTLAYESRPHMHLVDAYAAKAGVVLSDKVPRFSPDIVWPGEKTFRVLVCADASWPSRSWDKQKWIEVASEIKANGNDVIEIGRQGSGLGVGENLVGKFQYPGGLRDLAKLMTTADIFLGIDGFLMHLAQAVGLPVLVLFGCVYPGYRIHDWSKAKVVWLTQEQIPCAGCHHFRDAPSTYCQCPGDNDCMKNITVDMVLDSFFNRDFGEKPPLHIRPWLGYMK